MAKKKYLEIHERLKELDPWVVFNRSIVHVMADLQGFQNDYPQHKKLRIVVDSGGWDDPDEFHLVGTRMETDSERDKRLARAKKSREDAKQIKADRNAAEIEQLKELLTKHGGDLHFDIHKLMFDEDK
tara:strand:+ start:1995 stop:2378 length:384 start_codon:yes stop_codon:yes gene_type:complete